MVKTLWVVFIAGQIFSAGNINYQQEAGYYELNPIYGRHPSKEKVYIIKAAEIGGLYALTKIFPKHEKKLLIGANCVMLGFIYYDYKMGIKMEVRF